jgi:hypothetical protein
MTLQDAAVELLHRSGAIANSELVAALHRGGYRPRKTSLDNLHLDYWDVVKCGDLLVSTVQDSPLVIAFAALRQLGIQDADDLVGGIRRALKNGWTVRSFGRAEAAEEILTVFGKLDLDFHDVDTSLLDTDRRVVQLLRSKPGGICRTRELQAALEADSAVESDNFQLGYSPLLEMVGSGLYGVRGAPIDLLSAAQQRSRARSAWSLWGRLDRRRLWVEVNSNGQDLQARIPNDCHDVISRDPQPLVGLTGMRLGSLVVSGQDVHVDWAHRPPADWESVRRSAVLEFELHDRYARLLTGVSTTEDSDPRFVDGCFLHNGSWRAVVDAGDAIVGEGTYPIPKAVDGLSDLSEGERRDFVSDHGMVTVTCEPHAYRIHLHESEVVPVGGNLRIDITRERCNLYPFGPAPSATGIILHAVGLESSVSRPWQRVGATLGLTGADYLDVARRFADRGRFDLAELARAAPFAVAEPALRAMSSSDFEICAGQLVHLTPAGRRYARRVAGSGPLGLQWKPLPDPSPDPDWSELTLLMLRAWAAGNIQPVHLCRTELGWSLNGEHWPTIVDALRQVGREPGSLPSVRFVEPAVATSAFGARHALGSGDMLMALEITGDSWRSVSETGAVTSSTPLRALLCS